MFIFIREFTGIFHHILYKLRGLKILKFVVQNPDNTEDNYEIISGAPGDMLEDETIQACICRIWRQLIEKENEYRASFGIKYASQYVMDGPIIDAIKKSKEKIYIVKKA